MLLRQTTTSESRAQSSRWIGFYFSQHVVGKHVLEWLSKILVDTRQACQNNTVTMLHAKAPAELLIVDTISEVNMAELQAVGVPVSATQLSTSLSEKSDDLNVPNDTCLTEFFTKMGGLVYAANLCLRKEMRAMLVG